MGYVRAFLKLSFDDPELAGFEVRVRRLNIERLLELGELRHLSGLKDDTPEVREGLAKVFDGLAKVIVSWNLEDPVDPTDPMSEVRPVPVTAATVGDQDIDLLLAIVDALTNATTGVSGPLVANSSGGDQLLEASLPMELSSPNPES